VEDHEAESITELCVNGLTTDGAHHKQWYLESILSFVIGKKKLNALKQDPGWEEGIIS
jgi:hypothetical protein